MKVLITFFLGLFLMKGCSQYKELEQIKIEYIANTRGFHQTVTIENKQFLVKNERDGKFNEIKLKESQWKSLAELYSKINIESFEQLKGSTKQRDYDGKAFANLHITKENKEYKTLGFDHTIPPTEIKPFVDLILKYANK
ncbi:hypothetical protein [Flavobacterium sp.]|uniref:hypothetical protein n=1 Tax=Flavobacterium sp. TaxID=239 RepID=UPI003F69FCB0